MSGQRSAGTPRESQLLSTCTDTSKPSAKAFLPPALSIARNRAERRGDSDIFSISKNYITKCYSLSNVLYIPRPAESTDNKNVDIVEKINNRLASMGMTWSDLAREMKITVERVNNWKKRGVPARQVKNVAIALGMQRHELEGDGSTHLRELTDEQIEVLAIWELLIPSEREEVKRRAEHNREVLANAPRVVRVADRRKAQTLYFGQEDRRKKEEG